MQSPIQIVPARLIRRLRVGNPDRRENLQCICGSDHGYKLQADHKLCLGDTVACRNNLASFLSGGCELSPNAAGFEIDGEDPIRVIAFKGLQRCLEFALVLAFLRECNPFGDFSDNPPRDCSLPGQRSGPIESAPDLA
jgi:hypothetical protein